MISTHKGCLFRDIEAGTLIRTGACFHFSCDWRGFARKKNDFQFHLWRRKRRGWCSNPPKYSPGKSAGDWPRGCIDFVISSSPVCSWCPFWLQLPILPIPMPNSPYVNCTGTTRHGFLWSSAKMQWACLEILDIGPCTLSEWSLLHGTLIRLRNCQLVVPSVKKEGTGSPARNN